MQKRLVSMMEFGAGTIYLNLNWNLVSGGFAGLLISAFLSYVIGFTGPFAFCGKFCLYHFSSGLCFIFFAVK